MNYVSDYTYQIGTRSVDAWNHCRPSALLAYLQEAATEAAVHLGVSREEMLREHNAFWMLARMWFRLERPLGWDEMLTIHTWHRGGKGVSMYRDFDLFVGEELVGEAVSTWVLADQDTRKMVRLSHAGDFVTSTGGTRCKNRLLNKIQLPDVMDFAEKRPMRYSDTDINGHVNNARYADFACDAIHLEQHGAGRYIAAMQMGYLAECRPGESLDLYTGQDEGLQFIRGAGEDGTARFDAWITLKET